MTKRSILLFPEITGMDAIQSFRKKHDPLAEKIRPHITLVFPFESPLAHGEVQRHIETCTEDISPFELSLSDISFTGEEWIWLEVKEGKDEIHQLHNRLYSGPLEEFKHPAIPYIPHLTLGRSELSKSEILNDWNPQFDLTSKIDTVFLEEIGEDENSRIISRTKL